METKRPAHFDLLGYHHVLRDRDVAAEAELNQDAARLDRLKPRANGPFIARRFEMNIEIALVGRIGAELIGFISDIDRPIRTEPQRLLQNSGHYVGRDDFPSTGLPSSDPARLTACRTTANGSAKAASLIETPSATLWHCQISATRR